MNRYALTRNIYSVENITLESEQKYLSLFKKEDLTDTEKENLAFGDNEMLQRRASSIRYLKDATCTIMQNKILSTFNI